MAGLASPLPAAVSRLLLLHGAVVRLCVCRVKILLLDGAAVSLGDTKAGRLIGRHITLRGTNIQTGPQTFSKLEDVRQTISKTEYMRQTISKMEDVKENSKSVQKLPPSKLFVFQMLLD